MYTCPYICPLYNNHTIVIALMIQQTILVVNTGGILLSGGKSILGQVHLTFFKTEQQFGDHRVGA